MDHGLVVVEHMGREAMLDVEVRDVFVCSRFMAGTAVV